MKNALSIVMLAVFGFVCTPAMAVPASVDLPVDLSTSGNKYCVLVTNQCTNGWSFWQHQSGSHAAGEGIGGANDKYAYDINLNSPTSNYDKGKPVYAIESGVIYTGDGWGGTTYGQLLVNHTTASDDKWSSGYLHMANIVKKSGSVTKGDVIGYIADVSPDNTTDHLHFAVYNTHGKSYLQSVNITFSGVSAKTPLTITPPTASLSTPADGATNLARPVPLTWTAQNATSYRVVVSANSSFSGFVDDGENSRCDSTCSTWRWDTTSGSFTAGQPDTRYYWRVRAHNSANGATSGWTPARSFSTKAAYTLKVFAAGAVTVVDIASNNGYGVPTPYDKKDLESGTQVRLTAPSAVGTASFSKWVGCTDDLGNLCSVTMDKTKSVIAYYVSNSNSPTSPTYKLTVSSSGASGVAISASPTDYSKPTNYSIDISKGTKIVLNAPSSAGSTKFSGWSGCDLAAGVTCNVTMNSEKNITASYVSNSRSNQTIAFGVAPTVRVGETGIVSASASSGLPVILTNLTTSICTLSGNTVKGVVAGTCAIVADQAGNGSYNPAPQARQDIAVTDASASCPRSADPRSKYKEWDVPGPVEVKTPALRGGNASHNLSPAELIYYSAKDQANNEGDRRAINPLLLITKLQTEMQLIEKGKSFVNGSGRGFDGLLWRAAGYGVCDSCTDTKWPGFYPQMIGSAYEWWGSRGKGKTFYQGLKEYTSSPYEWDTFRSAYRDYATAMNRIAGKSYPVEIGELDTHPYDSFLDISAGHIQQFLDERPGALKEADLFRQQPVLPLYRDVEYPCDTVVTPPPVASVSHFDGAGSLVDPRRSGSGCAAKNNFGCSMDDVALHSHGIPSTALFQVVGVEDVCESVELSSDLPGGASIELRSWLGYGTESSYYKLDKFPAVVPLKKLVSGNINVDSWNLIAVTTASALGSTTTVRAECSVASASNAQLASKAPTQFDNGYYWGGNGSIIGHSNSSETNDAIQGYGRTRDSAALMRDSSTLSALQVTKPTCGKIKFEMESAEVSIDLSWKNWYSPDWLGSTTIKHGDVFALPSELGNWVVFKIKAPATGKNKSYFTATCM